MWFIIAFCSYESMNLMVTFTHETCFWLPLLNPSFNMWTSSDFARAWTGSAGSCSHMVLSGTPCAVGPQTWFGRVNFEGFFGSALGWPWMILNFSGCWAFHGIFLGMICRPCWWCGPRLTKALALELPSAFPKRCREAIEDLLEKANEPCHELGKIWVTKGLMWINGKVW